MAASDVAHQPHLRSIFDTFDANKDGYLTLEELCQWMNKLGLQLSKGGLIKTVKACDWNGDGQLDFNEFVALSKLFERGIPDDPDSTVASTTDSNVSAAEKQPQETDDNVTSEMEDAFRVFDKDGNGLISPDELRSTLIELGLIDSPTPMARIQSMIRKVDTDGDGSVNYSEFEDMMSKGL